MQINDIYLNIFSAVCFNDLNKNEVLSGCSSQEYAISLVSLRSRSNILSLFFHRNTPVKRINIRSGRLNYLILYKFFKLFIQYTNSKNSLLARRPVKKKKAWKKNFEALRLWERTAGRFVIRSDWLEDPIEALKIYRRRNIVEIAFRQFKVLNDGDRLQAARTSYMGELMVHIIAQSLRMAINVQAKRRETSELKFPDDSVEKLLSALKRVRAVRAPTRATWVVEPLSKKPRTCLSFYRL